ncbi:MAG TPA: DNA-directed RNA polymerase subunit L [Candidatus Norongarragalinales archaeon]|nr:DNA-directed RNA polymerase subunit L [Candidatus Norongarragalinales archaeon]
MEIKVLKDEDNYLELMLMEQDVGFSNLIVSKLLETKSVTFAASSYEHPLKGNPILKIKAKSPHKELKHALKGVVEDVEEFQKALKKELK